MLMAAIVLPIAIRMARRAITAWFMPGIITGKTVA